MRSSTPGRRQAPATVAEGTVDEWYWRFLAAAVALAAVGALLLRERAELWLQLAATTGTTLGLWRLFT